MRLTRKNRTSLALFLAPLLCLAMAAVPSLAQNSPNPANTRGPEHPPSDHHGNHGRWWDNPHVVKKLNLTDAQKQRMDQIFDKHRPRLKQLNSTLKQEEATLFPLLQADNLNENKILHQIDTVAQARANLEKANARMLFGLRKVLTQDQWKKLQEMAREWHEHHPDHGPGPGHPMPPPGPRP